MPLPAAPALPATPGGERKQVTVLFADIAGSMALAEGADPEDWAALMDRLFRALSESVVRFEGTVDKFTGDRSQGASHRNTLRKPPGNGTQPQAVAIGDGGRSHSGRAPQGASVRATERRCGGPGRRSRTAGRAVRSPRP